MLSAQYYKNKYSYIGHFWQDRFKSIIVSKDEYLLVCGSYVELNPVRAKIVEDTKDYRWSSYHVYAYGIADSIVDEHPIYHQFADDIIERRKKYRKFVKGMLREKEAMKGEMDRKRVFGSAEFISLIKERFNLASVIRPIGRPRKK